MIELLQSIPAKYRQATYFGYVAVAFVLGAIHVGMNAAGVTTDPTWFTVTGEVVKYASVPILAVAGVNVTTADGPPPAPEHPKPQAEGQGHVRRIRPVEQPGQGQAFIDQHPNPPDGPAD